MWGAWRVDSPLPAASDHRPRPRARPAYKCNRKRHTLRVVIRNDAGEGHWNLDLVFTAPGAGDASAASARALELLGAAFLIGKRGTHIYKLFPDRAPALLRPARPARR